VKHIELMDSKVLNEQHRFAAA